MEKESREYSAQLKHYLGREKGEGNTRNDNIAKYQDIRKTYA